MARAMREVSLDYDRTCQRLRTLGFSYTSHAKLANLLLEWAVGVQQTVDGTRLHIALTHGELGECIGATRETVTRALSDFAHHHVIHRQGATVLIPNLRALEAYASPMMQVAPLLRCV